MGPTDGFARGTPVIDTGAPITVPVGPGTLGRIINVVGKPIDERGPILTDKFAPIHAAPPELSNMGDADDILITGIKVRRGQEKGECAQTSSAPPPLCTKYAPALACRSSTCSRRTLAAARSVSSAVLVSARRSLSWS